MLIDDLIELGKNECRLTLKSLLNTLDLYDYPLCEYYVCSMSFKKGIYGAHFLFYENDNEEPNKVFIICPDKVYKAGQAREDNDIVIITKVRTNGKVLFYNDKYCTEVI